jgi:DNA-binding transcriptional MerR regulator
MYDLNIMQNLFFTSKDASIITGCTLRQLQYWRENDIVVPSISSTGTGRSVYYSPNDVAELDVIGYCLRSGLTFEIAVAALKVLKEQSPDLLHTISQKTWLLSWDESSEVMEIAAFDEHKAMEWLGSRRVVIPLWTRTLSMLFDGMAAEAAKRKFLDSASVPHQQVH